MEVGVHLPQWGPSAHRRGVVDVARCAEAAGLDHVWVADHVVVPTSSASSYPYRRGGVPFAPADGFLEALATLGVVAGATERIGLGTSVLVAPQREPLLLAKGVATLDLLSEGRVRLALGAGWWAEEYAALGVPFERRGARFDELLGVLRALWADGVAEHHGAEIDFDEVACLPLPARAGGPPTWIGGLADAAVRRAARWGLGWHAVGADPDRLRAGRERLAALAAEAGTGVPPLAVSTSCGLPEGRDEAQDRLARLARAGVGQVVLNSDTSDHRRLCREVERLAADVLAPLATELGRHTQPPPLPTPDLSQGGEPGAAAPRQAR